MKFNKEDKTKLHIIPFYTGRKTLPEALKDRKSLQLLWLEILFNDSIDWESLFSLKVIKDAYDKAAIWYANFKTIVNNFYKRKPLKIRKGTYDAREYRRFMEVVNFVAR